MVASTRKLVLVRLPYLGPQSELRIYRGKFMGADEIPEVRIDLGPGLVCPTSPEIELPPCPDCGGVIGTAGDELSDVRKCVSCGSMFLVELQHVRAAEPRETGFQCPPYNARAI